MSDNLKQTLSDISALRSVTEKETGTAYSNLVVDALAGTGKTFTMIVGIAWAYLRNKPAAWKEFISGLGFEPSPSPQQLAVWQRIEEQPARSITYCAFNNSIVNDFGLKWKWLVELLQRNGVNLRFCTINALGYRALRETLGWIPMDNKRRLTKLFLEEITGRDIRELWKHEGELVPGTESLIGLCKVTMTGWTAENGFDSDSISTDDLDRLASHYNVELNGSKERVYEMVPQILNRMRYPKEERGMIDFNDQNWLPVIHRLPVPKSDLLLVDEGQDLNRCKQEYCIRAGKRILLVGDINQAIYGFAGADVESIPRMKQLLNPGGEPVAGLPLTKTYRCGKAIVAEAQKIVPSFEAAETNPEGVVEKLDSKKLLEAATDGDMILCRVNAPLVSTAFRFLKDGRKAVVRGKKIGEGLITLIKKLNASDVAELQDKVEAWFDSEVKTEHLKKFVSEERLISLQDKRDCLISFCEDATGIPQVIDAINRIFSGRVCPKCRSSYDEEVTECYKCKCTVQTPEGVLLSSVHRAKGLEADNVFILIGKAPMPHPSAKSSWQRAQEMNLKYVAITRAKHRLTWVV